MSPAVYCYTYVDDSDGNACIVYVWNDFLFQLGVFRIQNLQRTPVCVYSSMYYTFPVFFTPASNIEGWWPVQKFKTLPNGLFSPLL
jgi:hypothetical protein